MFATLDPIVRQVRLPSHRRILMSDTVGFIRNLPTTLVDAFRATLEEVTGAVLLLHVVDLTSPIAAEQTTHVMKVLAEIHAETTPQILVLNKCDALANGNDAADLEAITHRLLGETARLNKTRAALVSGKTGEGIPHLLDVNYAVVYGGVGYIDIDGVVAGLQSAGEIDGIRRRPDGTARWPLT